MGRKTTRQRAAPLSHQEVAGGGLQRWLALPDLAQRVPELPRRGFAALVQQIGVEDAGELAALATDEQLQAALDEDLFVNARPGEPEVLDGRRFGRWLEVLQEAGEAAVAARLSSLSVEYCAHAMSSLVLVLDAGFRSLDRSARADRLIEEDELRDALGLELRGYLLLPRVDEAWDAALSALLALDREQGTFLEQVLERCARAANALVEDEDTFQPVLGFDETLAQDALAEREQRREQLGYVDPQDAAAFLRLAKLPWSTAVGAEQRDPITRAHLHGLEELASGWPVPGEIHDVGAARETFPSDPDGTRVGPGFAMQVGASMPFVEALAHLQARAPTRFGLRMQELAYLANVILAGTLDLGRRWSPPAAAEAAFATVALGAELFAGDQRRGQYARRATARELSRLLAEVGADLLFRRASSALCNSAATHIFGPDGLLRQRDELEAALAAVTAQDQGE